MSEFYPSLKYISDITQARNAVVTCEEEHDFIDNEIVSFRVSKDYGMAEMNNKQAKVISHDSTTITVDIDSSNFTAFSIPGDLSGTTAPCVVPSASGVDLSSPIPRTVIEDAFDNRP